MTMQNTTLQVVRELVRTLDQLRGLHEELFQVLEGKIEAMRTANVDLLQAANQAEADLLGNLREKDAERATLMQATGRELGLAGKNLRNVNTSQLSGLLPAPERELLSRSASKLQKAIAKTAQANRIAATVAREVTNHMKAVFSAVRPARSTPVGYTPGGESFVAQPAIMDVVG